MVTDGVTWAYHERGRLRPESVKVIEKCVDWSLCAPWLVLGGEPRARAASSSDRIESGAWRWPCVAPLAGPSVGVVDRRKGENIGEVIGFLVVHQSGKQNDNQRATEGRRDQDYKLHCNCP